MFSGGVWKKYFFILHQEVLIFTDINQRTKIIGKVHMQISKVHTEDQTFLDGEIRINSGLIDVRLKAPTIKEKINWKNAFSRAQKKQSDNTSNPRKQMERKDEYGSKSNNKPGNQM
jgi:phosphorylcholine metabolism protein LicD